VRVGEVARIVAFKTAVSPNGLLDASIVLFWSFKLLGDLCRIYNLAVGPLATALLLLRVVVNAYVAVRIDAWEEYADDTLENVMENLPISDVGKRIVGRISVKSGTGLANYLLVRRLGKHAIGLLRPVARR
jgi:putative membrane protein